MAAGFDGRVKVSVEEYGNSPMATRFGVRRYPAVFVDDVLVARPKDFGFGGDDDTSGGLYVPWLNPENQRRFKDDLRRAVERRLAGEHVTGFDLSDVTTGADAAEGPAAFPSVALRDIHDVEIAPASLAGKTVIVEMWATWCPPCRSTLEWLDTFQRSHASDLAVIALAVDSKLEDVRTLVEALKPSYRVVFASPDMVKAFGAVAAVPKLMIFDRRGKRTQVLYGAPPDLHRQIEAAVAGTTGK